MTDLKRKLAMNRIHRTFVLIPAILLTQHALRSFGGDATENWLRLQRLNEQSQQQLQQLHRQSDADHVSQSSSLDRARKRLQAQQLWGLSQLQAQQRRHLIMQGHRQRVMPEDATVTHQRRLQLQRLRNNQAQRNLLNRYRMQLDRYRFSR